MNGWYRNPMGVESRVLVGYRKNRNCRLPFEEQTGYHGRIQTAYGRWRYDSLFQNRSRVLGSIFMEEKDTRL